MSHYVYLDSSERPRMPEGRAGEWHGFWAAKGLELEAKNGPPLLWWCLFGADDLRQARFADEFDPDDPASEEAPDDQPADATYPYFVTNHERALERLGRRRAAILSGIGARYADLYDGFAELIERDFGPHLLLRTAGLPDIGEGEPWLRQIAAGMDALEADPPAPPRPEVAALLDEFRRWQGHDPVWLLSGAGPPGIWPTPALAAAYPVPRREARAGALRPVAQGRVPGEPALWGAALLASGAGVGVFLATASLPLGGLAFLAAAVLSGWLLSRR